MQCHFSGDFENNPWWQMNFEEPRKVKSIKLFNFQNGANSSNLEGASIYVGETLCARIGDTLPMNQYIVMDCQDIEAPPLNRFSPEPTKKFTGIEGDKLRIVSAQPGVLAACNLEIETFVVDLELEKEIEQVVT